MNLQDGKYKILVKITEYFEVQDLLFNLGCKWINSGHEMFEEYRRFIYVQDGVIVAGENETHFMIRTMFKEINIDDLRDLLGETK